MLYDPRTPSEIEYTFFKNDLSSIADCYEKLQEVLELQKKTIEDFIEDYRFGNNWKLYGAEPYLLVLKTIASLNIICVKALINTLIDISRGNSKFVA